MNLTRAQSVWFNGVFTSLTFASQFEDRPDSFSAYIQFLPWCIPLLLLLFIIISCSIWKMILFFPFHAPLSSIYTHRRATYLQSVLVGLWLIWHVWVAPNESWGTQGNSELVKPHPCYPPGQCWSLWFTMEIAPAFEDGWYSRAGCGPWVLCWPHAAGQGWN